MKSQHSSLYIAIIIIISCFFLLPDKGYSQINQNIARGADTAEIYITTFWYRVPSQLFGWGGIFRSMDNGATLMLEFKYPYEQHRHEIYGDSMSGTIYLHHYYGPDTLLVSHDFGNSYSVIIINDNVYGEIASGCRNGEFYLGNMSIPIHALKRFTYSGDSLQITNNNLDSIQIMDVGTQSGELYGLLWPYFWGFNMDTLGIVYSNDYGQHFSVFYQDTVIISWKRNYTFSRGTEPGELYITGQDINDCYHIFHSTDYGQTLELKQITEPLPTCCEDISFTGGRTPGSFYMLRYNGYSSYHADVWIHYSNDYGATFTTYYHSLDSTLTGVIRKDVLPELTIFPNPATTRVTFRFGGSPLTENTQITIYDLFGKPVTDVVLLTAQPEITLDTRNLSPGIYFYEVSQNQDRKNGKIIIMK